MQELQQTEQVNYHFVEINGLNYKVINQLDEKKHVSNFYLPKKLVRQHPHQGNQITIKKVENKDTINHNLMIVDVYLQKF